MPAFNAEKYISESIISVINQTYSNWELIIVDDESTDKTSEIIKQYMNTDSRVKYFYQKNSKQGKARNTAFKKSNGEFIAFLDADDIWTNTKLEIQVKEMLANQSIDLIFSQGYLLNNAGIENYNITVKSQWNNQDLPTFINCNQIPILSVLVKTQALKTVEIFSEDLRIQNVEDYHLWLKLLDSNFKFKSIENRLFYYRIHQNQSTYQSSNTNIPMLNMLCMFYDNCNSRTKTIRKSIIDRTKMLMADEQVKQESFNLIKAIQKKQNPIIYLILHLLPPFLGKIRYTVASKLS